MSWRLCPLATALLVMNACAGQGSTPAPPRSFYPAGQLAVAPTMADNVSGGPCAVSMDGLIWYDLRSGAIPPIEFTHVNCKTAGTIDAERLPSLPDWARPTGRTNAIFVATSLQERYSLDGMQAIARIGAANNVPVTWMVGNSQFIANNAAYYNQLHNAYGDDVEVEDNPELYQLALSALPWYAPAVSVEGAGHERHIAELLTRGNSGFWGITWNSHGTDSTSDEGSPWGSYCADVSSYKRPSPVGDCSLVAFEWTARDLTRAYFANTNAAGYSAEAAYSTDPDDILLRGGFDESSGQQYERALADAYAAAGENQPLVMMSQQESYEESVNGAADGPLLGALYQEASRAGMKAMTLRDALSSAKGFSAKPRAVAFPYTPGGASTFYDGAPFTPATIDFHDNAAGMTFVSGHTLPSRVFDYADDPRSAFNMTLMQAAPSSYPALISVNVANGYLTFAFSSSKAQHFGIALWTNPDDLMLSGTSVFPAGHAGVVLTFDLPPGKSRQSVRCAACRSATFEYSH